MSIYTNKTSSVVNYRKIYEEHFGPIPVDDNGRSYDIHHRDGNRENNSPDNLIALSVQEHYDLHFAQGDYGACYYILTQRLDRTPEETSIMMSQIATISNSKRWENKDWALKQSMKNSEVKRDELSIKIARDKMTLLNSDSDFIQKSKDSKKKWTSDPIENQKHRDRAKHAALVSVKPIMIDGVEYPNAMEVATTFNISKSTVRQRIRSKSPLFSGWRYKQGVEVFTILIDGKEYRDVKSAAESLGIPRGTIRKRLNNPLFSEWVRISVVR